MTVKVTGPLSFGGMGDDSQGGTDFGDVFVGGYGQYADAGNDRVTAYGGDDTIFGSDGADTLDGGDGLDLVDYSAAAGPVIVSLGGGFAITDPTGNDTLISIERVRGSAFGDTLTGSGGDDWLSGGAGVDKLDGGLGIDTASYADATDGVTANLAIGSAVTATGTDSLVNIENLEGGAFGDKLTGNAADNVLDGGAGNDVLWGGAGNDTLVGGIGDDTAVFSGNLADYRITTLADGRVTVSDQRAGADGTDTLVGIRHLQFADQKMDLTGIDRIVAAGAQGQSVTGLADGGYVIAWQAPDASGSGVFFRQFDADGTPTGAVTPINTATAGAQQGVVVTALYDGGFVAVYQSATATGWDVALQRFNADGSANGAEVVLGKAGDQLAPAVSATIDGGFVVVWHAAGADGTADVRATRIDWSGEAQGEVLVNTTTAGQQLAAAVAEQDNGYMVAWQSDNGSSHKVLVQQYRWDGEAVGGEVALATTGVVGSVGIATLYGGAGGMVAGTVVTWIQDDGNAATADDAVMVQRFDVNGAAVGRPVTVATAGFQHEAAVTGLRDGGFIVVWDSVGADGKTTVMGRYYKADGSAYGGEWQVNQMAVAGQLTAPSVAEAADGHVIVSWTTTAADGTSRVWQQAIGYDGAAEFTASGSSGEPPATPQFSVEAVPQQGAALAAAAPSRAEGAGTASGPVDQGVFDQSHLLVTGSADAGTTITLFDAGVEVARAVADGSGSWRVEFKDLAAGAHHFSATATDGLGQTSAASPTVSLVVLGTIDGTASNDNAAYFAAHGANGDAQKIDAGAGHDTIDGGGGADTLAGGAGNDTYIVDNSGVTIVENVNGGTDTVQASVDIALADNVEHLVFKGAAGRTGQGNALNNSITGSTGDDALYGADGKDTLTGGAGNDTLDGGTGADALSGGAGDDYYVVDTGDAITEANNAAGGIDTVATALAAYTLGNGLENLVRLGDAAFAGTGNAQANDIAGGTGNDKLDGGAGNDTLRGNGGQDTLMGGAGADALYVGSGNAIVEGGADSDTVYLAHAFGAYTRVRNGATELRLTGPDGYTVVVRDVERFVFDGGAPLDWSVVTGDIAGPGNQKLTGTAQDDRMDGGTGDDTLAGGAGNDTYAIDAVGDRIEEAVDGGIDTAEIAVTTRGATYALAANVENAVVTSTAAINVTGNELANRIAGNDAANTLSGGAGNDTLDGGGAADRLDGGAGDDQYVVDVAGDQVIEAKDGGHDTVVTKTAAWTLAAYVEDLRYDGTARSTLTGNGEDNTIVNGNGGGKLSGLAGADTLVGGTGADSLAGGDGDDELRGGGGADTLDGGAGDDTAVLDGARAGWAVTRTADRELQLRSGATTLVLRDVEHLVFADGGVTFAELVAANKATAWADGLTGTAQADTMNGEAGADTMTGLAGDDVYIVDTRDDVVVEAADGGVDTVRLAIGTTGAAYVLAANVEHATITSTAALAVTGNVAANALTGNGAANALSGLDGDDTLDGGAGNDTLTGGAGDDQYVVDVAGDQVIEAKDGGHDTVVTKTAAWTLAAYVEDLRYDGTARSTLTGNGEDNTIVNGNGGGKLSGMAGADTLVGGTGADSLAGGDGDDELRGGGGADTLDGGAGDDTAVLDGARAGWAVTRTADRELQLRSGATTLVLRDVEHLVFADGALTFAEVVAGNKPTAWADALTGTDAGETIDGGAGADTMAGLAGDDVYVVDTRDDVVVEAADGGIDTVRLAIASTGAAYVLAENVEHASITSTAALAVTGNGAANALTGNAAANALSGLAGNDTLDGGAGNDTLAGDAGDDALGGGVGNDRLDGGDGNDTLDGGAGSDSMAGGAGDDVYVVDASGDTVTEAAQGGTDTVRTNLASYTLGANVENLAYTGSAPFVGTGNALANTIDGGSGNDRLSGGDENDTLRGHAGNDTLDGGNGSDTAVIDGAYADYTVSALVAGETLLTARDGTKIVLKGIETVAFADRGLALAQLLYGATTLGNDVLVGSTGADTLDGASGADTMTGLAGDDVYLVDNAGDRVVEAAHGGHDTVRIALAAANGTYVLDEHVEDALVTGTVATHVTGNDADNVLTGNAAVNTLSGGAGDDSLLGMAGNDSLQGGEGNDTLDGGAGNDVLAGGAGDDVYVVDSRSDSVTESAGGGHDEVRTALASWELGLNVEDLVYTGTGAFGGTGNDGDNLIAGGRGADRLTGGGGNDTLAGGAGNDMLTGGTGNDVFRLDLGSLDTVADYAAGDTVVLDATGLKLGSGDSLVWDTTGGFASDAGLVVFSTNAAQLNATSVARAIGSAATGYHTGDVALFAIDNGASTVLFRFTSSGNDALVSAAELTQVATLTGVKDATLVDFELVHTLS